MSVVEQRFFSKFDGRQKNNKFWNITLHDDDSVEVNFGPQGQSGQHKTFPPGHKKSGRYGFDKYISEKTSARKGYTENKVLEGVKSTGIAKTASSHELFRKAVDDMAKGQPDLMKLIQYFADVNAHNLYQASGGKITYDTSTGLFRTTQGVVTLGQIQEARDLLNAIAKISQKKDFDSDSFFDNVNPYLSIIPQEGLVRNIDFEDMFGDSGLQRQTDILDGLETSYVSVVAQPKNKDTKNKSDDTPMFKVSLDRVDDKKEFDRLRRLYNKTKGGHRDVAHYDVYTVYSLRIETMAQAFESRGKKIGNVMQLWHGTKASNMLSILKGGFIIPKSSGSIHVTGRMFSDGCYFSDDSTKAIRYATGAWGGGRNNDRKFMFLADVAMGKSHIPRSGESWGYRLPRGYDSCFAKANVSGVMNNEMIVYQLHQINPVYILEFTPHGK